MHNRKEIKSATPADSSTLNWLSIRSKTEFQVLHKKRFFHANFSHIAKCRLLKNKYQPTCPLTPLFWTLFIFEKETWRTWIMCHTRAPKWKWSRLSRDANSSHVWETLKLLCQSRSYDQDHNWHKLCLLFMFQKNNGILQVAKQLFYPIANEFTTK